VDTRASETLERTTLEPGIPFLRKPWTLSELPLKVREVLDASPEATAPGPGSVD
jgi:hypothetical protein